MSSYFTKLDSSYRKLPHYHKSNKLHNKNFVKNQHLSKINIPTVF